MFAIIKERLKLKIKLWSEISDMYNGQNDVIHSVELFIPQVKAALACLWRRGR